MESKLTQFINNLNNIKETHPNIHHLWTLYINYNIKQLEIAIEKGEKMLKSTESITDLTPKNIITLYLLNDNNLEIE
uniref:Uncharacterized protein n=1 Tax=viral metagenome TaxID=1070528 RepID=A0A6C0KHN0_9ZZZZ